MRTIICECRCFTRGCGCLVFICLCHTTRACKRSTLRLESKHVNSAIRVRFLPSGSEGGRIPQQDSMGTHRLLAEGNFHDTNLAVGARTPQTGSARSHTCTRPHRLSSHSRSPDHCPRFWWTSVYHLAALRRSQGQRCPWTRWPPRFQYSGKYRWSVPASRVFAQFLLCSCLSRNVGAWTNAAFDNSTRANVET